MGMQMQGSKNLIFKNVLFLVVLFVIAMYPAQTGLAQSEDQVVPRLELLLDTSFDSQISNPIVFEKYFNNDKVVKGLTSYISYRLKSEIENNLTNLAITTVSVQFRESVGRVNKGMDNSHLIRNTIHVDDEVNLYSKLHIKEQKTGNIVLNVPFFKAVKSDIASNSDWLTLSDTTRFSGLNTVVENIADKLCSQIQETVTRWIIQSSIKFRVAVEEFQQIGSETESVPFYGEMLRTMVESELSRSEAILLHTDYPAPENPNVENLREKFLLNYVIEGKYVKIGDELRIDVRCIKRPFNRILVAKRAIVESIMASEVSRVMVDISNQIKRVMESDFTRQTKTLAFVPKASTLLTNGSSRNKDIVQEISRTLTQKLSRLTTPVDTTKTPYLNLQILGFSPDRLQYLDPSSQPSEIIADLDIDYLVLTSYDDIGEQVRISSSLHSFDSEIPAAAIFIHENTVDKTELNKEINKTIINLVRHLCNYGFVTAVRQCGELNQNHPSLGKAMYDIEMPSILRDKHFGFRFGGVTYRADKNLFLGEASGSYFEAYYSRMLPFLNSNRPGGRFDVGIEVGLGIDTGGKYAFNGAAVANSMINGKVMLTPWEYSQTATNFVIGGGIVFQGIRYNFKQGIGPYLGTDNYRDTAFRTTGNIFAEAEFPLWDRLAIDVLIRYIPRSNSIDTFKNLPLEGYEEGHGPSGQLGATYLIAGLKYLFH